MSKTTSPKALLALLSGHPALSALAKEARKTPAQEQNDPLHCLPPALRERVTDQHGNHETSCSLRLPKLQQALPGQQIKIVVRQP